MHLSRTYVFQRDIFFSQQCAGRDCMGRRQHGLLGFDLCCDPRGRVSRLSEPRDHEANAREHENSAYSEQDIA